MVEFIEKEHWTDENPFTGRTYAPVYMVKDGAEYFVVNRVVKSRDGSWARYDKKKSDDGTEQHKEFLRQHEFMYFKFNGFYDDPLEMLREITKRKHTFVDPDDVFWHCHKSDGTDAGFVDFHGNRNEVSAAFHYRIYDETLLSQIKDAVHSIIERSEER